MARLEVIYNLLKKICPNAEQSSMHILDIGCGDTFVVDNLSRRLPFAKFSAVDSEFTDTDISRFRERYKGRPLDVYRSLDCLWRTTPEQIDIILLLDVIEHVKDDCGFLKKLRTMPGVSDGTVFLLTVPAFQSLFSKHDVYLKHHRRYNKIQLINTLIDAGFHLQKSGYFFSSLLLVRVFEKAAEVTSPHNIQNEKGIGAWRSRYMLDDFIKHCLIIDYKVARWVSNYGLNMPGLSAYAICIT